MCSNRQLSIDEISGNPWPDPIINRDIVSKYHIARKKPIGELTPEEIFLFFEQDIHTDILLPIAIDAIFKEPFILNGDLLREILYYLRNRREPSPDVAYSLKKLLSEIPIDQFEELSELQMAVEYYLEE